MPKTTPHSSCGMITIRLILHNPTFLTRLRSSSRSLPLHSVTINYATQHSDIESREYCGALVGTLMREATASVGAHRAKRRVGRKKDPFVQDTSLRSINLYGSELDKTRLEVWCVHAASTRMKSEARRTEHNQTTSKLEKATAAERVVLLNSPRSACNIQAADTPLEEGYAVPTIHSAPSPSHTMDKIDGNEEGAETESAVQSTSVAPLEEALKEKQRKDAQTDTRSDSFNLDNIVSEAPAICQMGPGEIIVRIVAEVQDQSDCHAIDDATNV
ncbi:hypothetical protein BLNAU_19092 [Blattamonas nauphoetae]|uniref:Uncharacterized protein n=1 Tax=Blattamonas nauphoetae TaxID=2049346 RepID=A0ABQ9X2X2_9EUKA|nr:hypothetical protein BLNAU_19092 [Blattamonas nauphoetae]